MEEQDRTLITNLAWGSIEVTIGTQVLQFRDCKVWPGGARTWDWGETGTGHSPGVQPADIAEVLEKGIELLVLGRGVLNRLEVQPATEALLTARGVEVYIADTKQAVEHYNNMVQKGRRVGGVFHTTC